MKRFGFVFLITILFLFSGCTDYLQFEKDEKLNSPDCNGKACVSVTANQSLNARSVGMPSAVAPAVYYFEAKAEGKTSVFNYSTSSTATLDLDYDVEWTVTAYLSSTLISDFDSSKDYDVILYKGDAKITPSAGASNSLSIKTLPFLTSGTEIVNTSDPVKQGCNLFFKLPSGSDWCVAYSIDPQSDNIGEYLQLTSNTLNIKNSNLETGRHNVVLKIKNGTSGSPVVKKYYFYVYRGHTTDRWQTTVSDDGKGVYADSITLTSDDLATDSNCTPGSIGFGERTNPGSFETAFSYTTSGKKNIITDKVFPGAVYALSVLQSVPGQQIILKQDGSQKYAASIEDYMELRKLGFEITGLSDDTELEIEIISPDHTKSETWTVEFSVSDTYYVSASGDPDTATGQTAKPFKTVQKAFDLINSVNNGTDAFNIILLSDLTAEDSDFKNGNFVSIAPEKTLNLTIKSDGSNKYKLDANSKGRVIDVSSKTQLTLTNIVITGGNTNNIGDLSDYGGGISCFGGNLTLSEGCTVTGNRSYMGGAVYVASGAEISVDGGIITDNSSLKENDNSGVGGGFYVFNGSLSLKNCKIADNKPDTSFYAGIYSNDTINLYNNVTMTDSIYLYNEKTITLKDDLSDCTIGKIYVSSTSYPVQVLSQEDGKTYISSWYSKFKSGKNAYYIGSDGYLDKKIPDSNLKGATTEVINLNGNNTYRCKFNFKIPAFGNISSVVLSIKKDSDSLATYNVSDWTNEQSYISEDWSSDNKPDSAVITVTETEGYSTEAKYSFSYTSGVTPAAGDILTEDKKLVKSDWYNSDVDKPVAILVYDNSVSPSADSPEKDIADYISASSTAQNIKNISKIFMGLEFSAGVNWLSLVDSDYVPFIEYTDLMVTSSSGCMVGLNGWSIVKKATDALDTKYCAAPATYHKAYNYILSYSATGISAGNWYMPAICELTCIYNNRGIISNSLTAISKTYSAASLFGDNAEKFWSCTNRSDSSTKFDSLPVNFKDGKSTEGNRYTYQYKVIPVFAMDANGSVIAPASEIPENSSVSNDDLIAFIENIRINGKENTTYTIKVDDIKATLMKDESSNYKLKEALVSLNDYAKYVILDFSGSSLTEIPTNAFGYKNDTSGQVCKKLVGCKLPATIGFIRGKSFAYTGIKEITIPEGATITADNEFTGCESLTTVVINSSVTPVFQGCSNLENVTLGSNVTTISSFGNCSKIASITIPASAIKIKANAFYGCDGLTSVTFEDTSKVWTASSNAIDVSNSSTNVTYLTSTYSNFDWSKNE